MYRKKTLSILILLISIIGSGCNIISRKGTSENVKQLGTVEISITETIEVTISCNQNNIQTYLDKGWQIVSSSITEVPCSWKTTKANNKCNIKTDKGCSIIVPDIIGEKTTYILSKKVKTNKKATKK
ncbi:MULTISPECIES: hypothetical protein [Prochlorococcus]|uniref:Uncharacterized protein n=1 Tax=Prochlorococcus marinus (strain SARG / CCMP1375 / SS120) TaxID=167539 RepID=Q7VC30_PROMA|nr:MULTISPECIES: hypothetical protein [Prochlorococcus]AAP99956.1 Predicted protein [Prochlorococcus marinus subsp. marinus str. CCMP1375]KGG11700.1 putative Alpha-2-macroglobulin family N-termin [Prochlorococcus marinus str. LG]KGG18888.1 putative Alpha-2-macroglobulin family N-termin [Prochlorococcus marinus str. SS2]KGG23574.1 putative Alpha-2-macroglobulin family N-termin [Prochlorococcus marinus str. SS35]KGG32190.1 putative Alpha-2-macroglobulin family N-termin [Prochlorococcus marinus s